MLGYGMESLLTPDWWPNSPNLGLENHRRVPFALLAAPVFYHISHLSPDSIQRHNHRCVRPCLISTAVEYTPSKTSSRRPFDVVGVGKCHGGHSLFVMVRYDSRLLKVPKTRSVDDDTLSEIRSIGLPRIPLDIPPRMRDYMDI